MGDASGLNSITASEHIGPNATGDNIEAKRIGNYVWDGANWQRMTQPSGGGGDTQYAEGVTTSPATGTTFLGRYQASPSGSSTDNGLYAPLMDNFHQLKVVPVGTAANNITQINGASIALGQTTNSASLPVAGTVDVWISYLQ
jgi:hypothetical protein